MIRFLLSKLQKFINKKNILSHSSEEGQKFAKRSKEIAPKSHVKQDKAFTKQTAPKKVKWTIDLFEVPEKEGEVRFHDLNLPAQIMHGLCDLDFKYCTPIQAEILPKTLKHTDATGQAQTGTGKSAAFLITIFSHMVRNRVRVKREMGMPRALIMAPTRELVLQIEKDAREIGKYLHLRTLAVFGGMGYEKQKKMLFRKKVDIVVATPGRLLDFCGQGFIDLRQVEILVIDEADRMLDMGFIPDIRKIIRQLPPKHKRQTLFFSATLTEDVKRLSSSWTRDAFHVEVDPDQVAAESIDQKVYLVTSDQKFIVLYNMIKRHHMDRLIVFVNRRDETRDLASKMNRYGIECAVLSGEVSQHKRLKALENFRNGNQKILIATDVAARGIHVDDIRYVVNYSLPQDPEHYIHRIGRTGRAGASGTSVSFASESDSFYIPAIEDVLGNALVCQYPDDALLVGLPEVQPSQSVPGDSECPPKPRPRKRKPRRSNNAPKAHQPSSRQHRRPQQGKKPLRKRRQEGGPPKRENG